MVKKKEKRNVSSLRVKLKTFLEDNKCSEIRRRKKGYAVCGPWADSSICFALLEDGEKELISALNSVILSPRFNAI